MHSTAMFYAKNKNTVRNDILCK